MTGRISHGVTTELAALAHTARKARTAKSRTDHRRLAAERVNRDLTDAAINGARVREWLPLLVLAARLLAEDTRPQALDFVEQAEAQIAMVADPPLPEHSPGAHHHG